MRVLGFGTYDITSHPRVGVLIEGLRKAGNTVVELNRPLGIATANRVAALSSPSELIRFIGTMIQRWISLSLGSLKFSGPRQPDALLVGYMGHFDVLLARLLFPTTPIVLDHLIFASDTAKDRGASGMILNTVLRALDLAALRAAELIIVDTPAHLDMVPDDLRGKAIVVPVGAPQDWFDARQKAQLVDNTGPETAPLSVVFYGLFTPLQGAPAIAKGLRDAARERDFKITMIGTGQDYQECREILSDTDVTWIDWVDCKDLPHLISKHDVCVGILGTTPKAQRVIPNKVYQSMAAGCCVITSDTQSQKQMLHDTVMWCPAGDGDELAKILVKLSDDRELLVTMKRLAYELADRAFTPYHVSAPLTEALK
ncbi:MAG: glycosyltransferase [Scrofimicrobium sp.]